MVVRQQSGENHSRRHRNKRARVANFIVGLVFLIVFLFSLISFGTFIEKHRQIFDYTIYGSDANDTYGHCVLYADPVGDNDTVYPRIHLGRSGVCVSIIYAELFVAVYALVMTFVLFFKVVVGCPYMRCDLVVELIINTTVAIFQFLMSLVFSSGLSDTCKAFMEVGFRCSNSLLPPVANDTSGSIPFYGHFVTSLVFCWLSFLVLAGITVSYITAVSLCLYRRTKLQRERMEVLVNDEDNQVYAAESESELKDTTQ